MIVVNEATAFIPIWMVLAAAFGFLAGDAFGDCIRHRKDLKQANDELRDQLEKASAGEEPLDRELKHQRAVLHDVHRRIVAVSKGLEKRPLGPQQNTRPDLPDPAVTKPIPSETRACGEKLDGLLFAAH